MSIMSNVYSAWLGAFLATLYMGEETLDFWAGVGVSVLVLGWIVVVGFTVALDKSLAGD